MATNKLCYCYVNGTALYCICLITLTTICTVDITTMWVYFKLFIVVSYWNFGTSLLKMMTVSKHVGVKELKNTLALELCICWWYENFNVPNARNERCESYENLTYFCGCESELTWRKENRNVGVWLWLALRRKKWHRRWKILSDVEICIVYGVLNNIKVNGGWNVTCTVHVAHWVWMENIVSNSFLL